MKRLFYLLNLTVSGIKSIKNDIRLDFYKKTIDKKFDPELYKVKAIYGENGSGKSALITAIKIFRELSLSDNYLSESQNQNFLEEMINKETKFFKFNCEYIVDCSDKKIVYNYSIHLGKNVNGSYEIKYEKLMKKNGNYPNNNYHILFEITEGELNYIDSKEDEKEHIIKKTLNLLSMNSMINLWIFGSNVYSGKSGTLELDMIFCLLFILVINVYLDEEDEHELYFLRKRIKEVDKYSLGKRVVELQENINIFASVSEKRIDKNDFKNYEKRIGQLTQFIKIFKPNLESIDIDKKEDGTTYVCELVLNYGKYKINKEFESTGIKKLIRLFDCLLRASRMGIVFIDEMDSNLNDVYLCKLIEYFMYYGNGQLCFTTHNLDPMISLKENKNSIDFLTNDNQLIQWTSHGNASPDNFYRNGMIENIPFNIDATDFIGIFGE
ncbi:AAA family ATPase [Faecalibacillus intestinalis]|uniref:AAA family ATPase n=1 Tax=Faecalibacillus intestinalis TaxID=1982626 RepID=UPI003AB43EE6